MNCQSCDGKNREDARFCKFCGADLFAHCRMCGAVLDEDARFCDACGTPAGDAGAPAAPAVASRKVVTVLFADLSGSTALEERMDAESIRSILDRFYAAMRSEIERHGGTVVKFTGDGVMAAFGVPEVHEDDAARAVDAALAMREELEQLASDLQLDVVLNIGVNTGEVVVSEADDDVVGDAVNVAARLEGAATNGEVLVGEETWRITRATSRYEPVEPLTLKGKSEPVPAYRLLSVDERTADSAAAPFVGREAELGRLMSAFQDCVDANAARLVTIIGSPGLGKTRLARELMSELSDSARVRETRCDPAGSSTFAPIADALRAGSGISETDTEEEIVAALAARLPEDDPDRDRVAARASSIFGVGVPGTTEETFWAIRKLIEAAAHTQPVVFVLDDIHWAEPLLLDLIEHLAEWIRDAPILLVGTARPELRDLRPSLVEGGRASEVIALEGLDRAATAQLALNLLEADSLPDELLAKIPASTEGNPLFVRELVRMLVDDDVLRRTPDGWEVTVDVEAIQVPPTIQSLLSARVDRLRNDERSVIELASVVGKEFYRGAIVDLAPDHVKDLVDGCLESLRRKELVEPVGTYWIDEPVYRFHHALIRDAAYRRVLKERRAELHERVAGWLERKTQGLAGENDELLGFHLEQAHEYTQQLGRPDDALGGRAADLLGGAAQRALESDDLPAAATLSGRALDRLPSDDARRSELLLVRCEALLSMGDVVQGSSAVTEFDALADTQRLRAWGTCFSGQLATLTSSQRLQDTESAVAGAAAELAELGDQAGAAKAHTVHAATLARLGRFGECEAVLDHALTAARAANDRRRITATLGSAPHAALWGPNPVSRAGGRCLDIVRLLRITTGSPAVEATSLRCQAVLEALRGRTDAARRMLRSAVRTLTELGLQHELLEAEQFRGMVELFAGDAAAAEKHLRVSYEGFRKVGVDVLAAQAGAQLARAHLMLGEDAEAEAFLGTSEQLASQDLKTAIVWRSAKAELLARRGEFADARALAEEAVALADRTDALIDHGTACRSLAVVLRAAGDAAGAQEADARAFALFERKGATAMAEGRSPEPSPAQIGAAAHTAVADAEALGQLRNTCTELSVAMNQALDRDDWDVFADMQAENIVCEDRRVGFGNRWSGRAAVVENVRTTATFGASVDSAPLAIRGDRAALFLNHWRAKDPDASSFEVWSHEVLVFDANGRVEAAITFDADEIDAALAELDERYVADEGAAEPQLVALVREFARAYTARDPERLRAVFTDDLSVNDHRPASSGTLDLDGLVAWIESAWELTDGALAYASAVEALAPGRVLVRFEVRGTTTEGSDYETSLYIILGRRRELIAHAEQFLPEQRDLAFERFHSLTSDAGASDVAKDAGTSALRFLGSLVDCFHAQDWKAFSGMFSESFVREDRRKGLGSQDGRDAYVESAKQVVEVGLHELTTTPLAWRGERLVLTKSRFAGPSENTVEMLVVYELGDDGRATRVVNFDPDDFDAALTDLEERFVRGEGAPYADYVRATHDFAMAVSHNDWEQASKTMHDDVVIADRRPASWGELRGVEAYRTIFRSASEVLGARRSYVVRYVRLAENTALIEGRIEGTTPDGVHFDDSRLVVGVARDGKQARIEYFPLDAETEAIARFVELTEPAVQEQVAGPRPDESRLENECVRVNRRLWEYYVAEDWDGLRGLYREEHTVEDLRDGLRMTFTGPDENLANLKALHSVGGVLASFTPIAIRGQQLALIRYGIAGPDEESSFDSDVLVLNMTDGEGHLDQAFIYDGDDLGSALAELDEQFAAGEGASCADIVRFAAAYRAATDDPTSETLRRMLADDVVVVDRRPASFGEARGVEELLRVHAPQLMTSRQTTVARIIALARDRYLGEVFVEGVSTEGAIVDTNRLVLVQIRDGRLARMEYFPVDDEQAALSRFDALGPRPDDAPGPLENAATRFVERLREAMEHGDLQDFVDLHASSFTLDDRRAGLRNVTSGLDEIRRYWTFAREEGLERFQHVETLATRGDRLTLSRRLYITRQQGALFESERLIIDEVDERGLVVAAVFFDPDEIDAAFAELNERYMAGDGAAFADVLGPFADYAAGLNLRDYDAATAVLHPEWVLVDHRPASVGEIRGGGGLKDYVAPLAELVPDFRFDIVRFVAESPTAAIAQVLVHGTSSGAPIELSYYALTAGRDRLAVRTELFPIDAWVAAKARFDELGPHPDGMAPVLENASIRATRLLIDAFARRDWEFFAEYFTEDNEFDDRRKGIGTLLRGRDLAVENIRQAAESGVVRLAFEPLATRGEYLMLNRSWWDASDWEGDAFVVDEHNEHGQNVRAVLFDPDDLDAAYAELDRRYLAGEGRPYAALWEPVVALTDAYRRRDWQTFESLVAEGCGFVDHRPASLGSLNSGRDLARSQAALVELVQDWTWRFTSIEAISLDRCVVFMSAPAKTADGVEVDFPVYLVLRCAGGRFTAIEAFLPEDRDRALARFDELGPRPDGAAPALENVSVRTTRLVIDAFARRDWEFFAEYFTEDTEFEDRRLGMGAHYRGRDLAVENIRQAAENGVVRLAFETLATRGEYLMLSRYGWEASDWDVDVLVVDEHNEHGQNVRAVLFDPDDLDAAYAELDARYASGEGAAFASLIRRSATLMTAWNAEDWDSFRRFFETDVVFVDHRRLGVGEVSGIDPMLDLVKTMSSVAPAIRHDVVRFHALAAHGFVWEVRASGINEEGGAFDNEYLQLGISRGELFVRSERFALDDREAALARFAELGPRPDETPLENTCTRTWGLINRALNERREDAVAERLAPNVVQDDRRAGLRNVMTGVDAVMANVRVVLSSPVQIEASVLAVRGDRLALMHESYVSGANDDPDFLAEILALVEVDEEGRPIAVIYLDVADINAALAELDARFAAGDGAGSREFIRSVSAFVTAYNTRDWTTGRSLIADDVVAVDHRPASLGTITDADEFVRINRVLTEVVTDVRLDAREYVAIDGDCGLVRFVGAGHNPEEGPIELAFFAVVRISGGLVRTLEWFSIEDLADARSRYDEIVASPGILTNACVEAMERETQLARARDWETLRLTLTEDVTINDRRQGVTYDYVGRDAVVQAAIELDAPPVSAVVRSQAVVAVRGERLALLRLLVGPRGGVGFETEILVVGEIEERGLLRSRTIFDPDDLDTAFAELNERYFAGEGASHAPAVGVVLDLSGAYNLREWTSHNALLTDDFVFVDHRPASAGTVIGGDALVRYLQTLIELVPDVTGRIVEITRAAPDRVLARMPIYGTTREGGAIEMVMYTLHVLRDGRACRLETFPSDQLEAALARFDELGPRPDVDHAAARWVERNWALATTGDWDALGDMYADDVVFEDHRSGLGARTVGRDAIVDQMRTIASFEAAIRPAIVANRGERLVLLRCEIATAEGFEVETLLIVELDAVGRNTFTAVFDPDDLDAALGALDTRFLADDDHPVIRWQAQRDAAMAAGDRAAVTEMYAEDAVFEDRRSGLGVRIEGRDAVIGHAWLSAPGVSMTWTMLATRGERLALIRSHLAIEGGYEVDALLLQELDATGRKTYNGLFDPEDLDGALRELDERFLACADATDAGRLQVCFARAHNDRDPQWVRDNLTEDFVLDDHRLASLGQLDADGWESVLRSAIDLLPDRRFTILTTQSDDSASLTSSEGTDAYGTVIRWEWRMVWETRGGKLSRLAVYGLDSAEEAHAHAARVASPRRRLENASTRQWQAFKDAWNSGTWDGSGAEVDADVVIDDRRSGLSSVMHGRDAYLAQMTVIKQMGAALRLSTVATRGDRLSLVDVEWHDPSGRRDVTVRPLHVNEVDEEGRLVRSVIFEPDNLDEAFTELDASYAAGEGAPFADIVSVGLGSYTDWNRRDWTKLAQSLAEDIVFVDRRPASLGRIEGREALMSLIKDPLTPDIRHDVIAIHAIAHGRSLIEVVARGTNPEGGEIELAYLQVVAFRDGRGILMERFATTDLDAALARFEELAVRADSPALENAATRVALRQMEVRDLDDMDFWRDLCTPDVRIEDRRALFQASATGLAALVGTFTALKSLGLRPVGGDVVATRGDRLALFLGRLADEHDNVIETLCIFESAPDGRLCGVTFFEHDDLEAAFEELDARYLAGEGAPYAEVLRLSSAQRSALRSGDWDAYRSVYADDVVLIDHRPASLGEVHGVDDVVGAVRALAPLVSAVRPVMTAIHRLADDRLLIHASARGAADHGGAVEMSHLRLQQFRNGRVVRVELFPIDALDEAIARFNELEMEAGSPSLENAATRAARRSVSLIMADDFDAYVRDLAPDVAFEDRRSLLRHESQGPEALIEQLQALRSLGTVDIQQDVIAIRGEGLALMRTRVVNGELPGFDVDALTLTELDEEARTSFVAIFEPDDFDAAHAELDERFASGEGRFAADLLRATTRLNAAMNANDWTAMRKELTNDIVLVDRRPVTWGELSGVSQLEELFASGVRAIGRRHSWHARYVRLSRNVGLVHAVVEGVSPDGVVVDQSRLIVGVRGGSGFIRIEYFRLDDEEAAVARYEELSAEEI